MGFLDYFRRSKASASIAKDRLQIVIARERTVTRDAPDYLPALQQELLQVIAKYELIDLGQVNINVEKNGDTEVLELNVVLAPSKPEPKPAAVETAKPAAVAS